MGWPDRAVRRQLPLVDDYNLMGRAKAALVSSVRYMAIEAGGKRVRLHALSPGPLNARTTLGIDRFDELPERMRVRTTEHRLVDIHKVGHVAAMLTASIEYVDAGYHIVA